MPFILIKGHFKPLAGIPDGDSVRFLADNLSLWRKLEGSPVEPGKSAKTLNTVQLRFEGIDAIEKGAIKPLSTQARDNMLKLIGMDKKHPEPVGYILARMTDDKTRRPICFVFAGTTTMQDGADVFLDPALLRKSVNYQQAKMGFAYPLYYNTLFAALRKEFTSAVASAKKAPSKGCWPQDRTLQGVTVRTHDDLKTIPPIWPKLWRRLDEYLRKNTGLSGFHAFLAQKNERIDVLSEMEERGLQDLVVVQGDMVKLNEPPENLRVVGSAGQRKR